MTITITHYGPPVVLPERAFWYPTEVIIACPECGLDLGTSGRSRGCTRCNESGIVSAYECRQYEWHATVQGARECTATVARGELVTP